MTPPSPTMLAAAEELQKRVDELASYLFEQKHPALYRAWKLGDTGETNQVSRARIAMQQLALTIAILERNQKDMEMIARMVRDLGKEASAFMATLQAKLGDGRD